MQTLKSLLPILLLLLLPLTACESEPEPMEEVPAATEEPAPIATQEPAAQEVVKLNLNTATREEFLTVPEVGDRMAHEFEEYRPYISIQQFRREMAKYVDDAQIAGYENYVFVPVNFNESDAATLMQLPGVSEETAEILIADRPYADQAMFLEILAKHVSADEHAAAAQYLSP